jgi:hypothetical protein
MSRKNAFNFSKGEGIPYRDVSHLLYGTKKSKAMLDQQNDLQYFLDENIRGYGWGSTNNELEVINQLELLSGDMIIRCVFTLSVRLLVPVKPPQAGVTIRWVPINGMNSRLMHAH